MKDPTHPQSPRGAEDQSREQVDGAFSDWVRTQESTVPREALEENRLHFVPNRKNSIDLGHSNPSGLAQLLMGRKTRLSTLILGAETYQRTLQVAQSIQSKAAQLRHDHGVESCFLACGLAQWTQESDDGEKHSFSLPVLLAPIALSTSEHGSDVELQITGRAFLNPVLREQVEAIAQADAVAPIADSAYATSRLDPGPAFDRVRNVTLSTPTFSVQPTLCVSLFTSFADPQADPMVRPTHPLLQALAEGRPLKQTEPASPPLDERDPRSELLVVDADQSQQEAIDRAVAGQSLIVDAAPGTGVTQSALNMLAGFAQAGKQVLLVAERAESIEAVRRGLERLDLGTLLLDAHAAQERDSLREHLIQALRRNESAREPSLNSLYENLKDVRHRLRDHVQSLHNVRARWDASPYQAMQALARLTSLEPAPATHVRLKRSVLDALSDRGGATELLERSADLGTFEVTSADSAWFGARLSNRQLADEALELAKKLDALLPQLQTDLDAVAAFSQVKSGENLEGWALTLELLVAVRASLDKFKPDIYDRPVTDLISATASNGWRREHGVEMSSMTRSRLRRVAKDYIRPGVHIDDLHTSLVEVQSQRELWENIADSKRHPTVPAGLAETSSRFREVLRLATELQGLMQGSERGSRLVQLPLTQVRDFVFALIADQAALVNLPEQTLVNDELESLGLSELVADLAARHVEREHVADELELAWWQSALEAMISGDEYLAMSDGQSLRELEADYRLADSAHIASGAARLRYEIANAWRAALEKYPEQAGELREVIKSPELTLGRYLDQSRELVARLTPVVAVGPHTLEQLLGSSHMYDVAIILDAGTLDVPSALPVIARASQVVLLGDSRSQVPQPFSVSAEAGSAPRAQGASARNGSGKKPVTSVLAAMVPLVPSIKLDHVYRSVDEEFTRWLGRDIYGMDFNALAPARALGAHPRGVSVEFIPDGTGMPNANQDSVASSEAEVTRVVDLVFEHIKLRPKNSLAVVTPSEIHAVAIEDALRERLQGQPWAQSFFAATREPFVVMASQRSPQVVRDCVIVSLGFARTPHGRALHDFGALSEPGGRQIFTNLVTRSRYLMHVVTSILPEQLEYARLSEGARDLYTLLDALVTNSLVQRKAQEISDPLIQDLMERLRSYGMVVRDDVDAALDAAAAAPAKRSEEFGGLVPGEGQDEDATPFPLAMVSDGTSRYAALSVRERSRQRPERLERLGWRYVPLWTIEVFTDPATLASNLAKLLNEPVAVTARVRQGEEVDSASASINGAALGESTGDHLIQLTEGAVDPMSSEFDQVPGSAVAEGEEFASPESLPAPKPSTPQSRRELRDAQEVSKPRHRFSKREDSVIPRLAKEDDPSSWGEAEDSSREKWIKEQRPPHHG